MSMNRCLMTFCADPSRRTYRKNDRTQQSETTNLKSVVIASTCPHDSLVLICEVYQL